MVVLEVKVYDNDIEKALKILKNKLSKSGLFKELKLRRAYEKPSVRGNAKPSKLADVMPRCSAAEVTENFFNSKNHDHRGRALLPDAIGDPE